MPRITHDTRAIVTGAGSGIGRAFALELARRGGRVVCADINPVAAQETAQLIGSAALACAVDVTDATAVEALADDAERWFGAPADLVVNNAGVAGGDRIGDFPLADWHWIMNVNLWGVIHGCHVHAPRMRRAGRGAILNVASSASFLALPGIAPYNVSKAGVLSLSETLAAELSGSGVRVGVLCPTLVRTNITRNARTGQTPPGHLALVDKLMARVGMTPEDAVRHALDGLDRDRFYLVPQLDARLFWHLKRHTPRLHTRLMGVLDRLTAARYGGRG